MLYGCTHILFPVDLQEFWDAQKTLWQRQCAHSVPLSGDRTLQHMSRMVGRYHLMGMFEHSSGVQRYSGEVRLVTWKSAVSTRKCLTRSRGSRSFSRVKSQQPLTNPCHQHRCCQDSSAHLQRSGMTQTSTCCTLVPRGNCCLHHDDVDYHLQHSCKE